MSKKQGYLVWYNENEALSIVASTRGKAKSKAKEWAKTTSTKGTRYTSLRTQTWESYTEKTYGYKLENPEYHTYSEQEIAGVLSHHDPDTIFCPIHGGLSESAVRFSKWRICGACLHEMLETMLENILDSHADMDFTLVEEE